MFNYDYHFVIAGAKFALADGHFISGSEI